MKQRRIGRYPCVVQNSIDLISRGRFHEAVDTLPLLFRKGFSLNTKAIASLIRQCATAKCIKEGKLVHLHLKLTARKHPNTVLSNHLINMYAKCGDHVKARQVFDKMRSKNLYSWNIMLAGYANLGMMKAARKFFYRMPARDFVSWNTMVMACVQGGLFAEALKFYMELRRLHIGFNKYSFAGVLTASVKLGDLWLARQLHCQVLVLGFFSNLVLSSSILDAYAKCGNIGDARKLFDEVRDRDVLAWTALVSGYARGGDMKLAREVFDAIPDKNSVSWATLITGYAHNGMGHCALKVLSEMIWLNVKPDQFAFNSCLFACAGLGSLEHGKQLHSYLITSGIRPNAVVTSSLIDMYSKCGRLEAATKIFLTMKNKQHTVLWNTMMSAFSFHGRCKEAIKIFIRMGRLGLKPDGVTFFVLLNACKHSGFVRGGLYLFKSMTLDYCIVPDQEHYACLIDILGQSKDFEEMVNQLKNMRCKPDEYIWNSFLDVCRIHGNLELGRLVARYLVELEPRLPAACLLLSGIYAALGRWESAQEIRRLTNVKHVEEGRDLTWLEIDRMLNLDTGCNKLHSPEGETTSVWERLADGSSLFSVAR
ncbi:pentatricopeptide repeat-containing protein At2g21090 [Andrographis paniculata]|uniref:pentatricopeptide repeat-containing protein At2g21090 n=1 Tax=Andrographis paniculata TaxID=175694 RepID=UPI0021E7A5EE|nr:pentatricopeptide repeat-containing protein At2g21090 [Andrographis paniculata]